MANIVVNTIDGDSLLQAIKSMLLKAQLRQRSVFKGVKTVKMSVSPFECASAVSGFTVPSIPMVKIQVNGHTDIVRCDKLDVFDLSITQRTEDICLVCRSKNQCADSKRIQSSVTVSPMF